MSWVSEEWCSIETHFQLANFEVYGKFYGQVVFIVNFFVEHRWGNDPKCPSRISFSFIGNPNMINISVLADFFFCFDQHCVGFLTY